MKQPGRGYRRFRKYGKRGQRRIDVLELLRIVDALQGDSRAIFAAIIARRVGKASMGRKAARSS
jgi:hypothetical protein